MLNENATAAMFDIPQPPCPNTVNMDMMTSQQVIADLEAGRHDWESGRARPAEEVFAELEARLGL